MAVGSNGYPIHVQLILVAFETREDVFEKYDVGSAQHKAPIRKILGKLLINEFTLVIASRTQKKLKSIFFKGNYYIKNEELLAMILTNRNSELTNRNSEESLY